MSRFDLNEIDLREGEARIRLVRGAVSLPVTASAAPQAAAAAPAPGPTPPAAAEKPAASSKAFTEIKSPTLGTFYSKPSPDAPPFVKVGSKVTPTTVVCLIE